jgi:hypothetical protein
MAAKTASNASARSAGRVAPPAPCSPGERRSSRREKVASLLGEACLRDEHRAGFRKSALPPIRKCGQEHLGDEEGEHGIPEELQCLVVSGPLLVGERRVRQGVDEEAPIGEHVPHQGLDTLEIGIVF